MFVDLQTLFIFSNFYFLSPCYWIVGDIYVEYFCTQISSSAPMGGGASSWSRCVTVRLTVRTDQMRQTV